MGLFTSKRMCWGCLKEFERRDLFELYEVRESKDRRLVCRSCAEQILTQAVEAYEGVLLAVEPLGGTWDEYAFTPSDELIENHWSEEFVEKLEETLTGLRPACDRCGRPAHTRYVDDLVHGGGGPFDGVLDAENLERDETLCGRCAVQSVFGVIDGLEKPPKYIGIPLSARFAMWDSSQM